MHAINVAFPNTFHGLCTYHLWKNIEKYFKDASVSKLFDDVARTYRESKFKALWDQIIKSKKW